MRRIHPEGHALPYHFDSKKFFDAVADAAKLRGQSVNKLCEELGISRATLTHIQKHGAVPRVTTALILCQALDLNPFEYLIDMDKESVSNTKHVIKASAPEVITIVL